MRFSGSCLVTLALLAVVGQAHAQTTISKKTLTLEGAKAIAAAAGWNHYMTAGIRAGITVQPFSLQMEFSSP